MAKVIHCRDIGFDCDGIVRAETEEQVVAKAAEHAQTVHNVSEITPKLAEAVRAAIRDE
jgi:predicted small metal-binding protein